MERRTRGLTVDMHDASPLSLGDYLLTRKKDGTYSSIYRIRLIRRVKRKDPDACPRYACRVQRVDTIPEGKRVVEFRWYPRKKKKLTFEQYMKRQWQQEL